MNEYFVFDCFRMTSFHSSIFLSPFLFHFIDFCCVAHELYRIRFQWRAKEKKIENWNWKFSIDSHSDSQFELHRWNSTVVVVFAFRRSESEAASNAFTLFPLSTFFYFMILALNSNKVKKIRRFRRILLKNQFIFCAITESKCLGGDCIYCINMKFTGHEMPSKLWSRITMWKQKFSNWIVLKTDSRDLFLSVYGTLLFEYAIWILLLTITTMISRFSLHFCHVCESAPRKRQ